MSQPVATAGDRALLASLSAQRDHVLGILDGLPGAALHRPVLPSGWTCLGLVRHLALDVERFWFRGVVAGQPVADSPDAWQVPAGTPAQDVLGLYRREIALADAVIAATPLDTPPAWWPSWWPDWRHADLRETILHVITETACHAGHLDAVRELIDGRTWMVVP
ncbi:MAG: DinB family protein [Actinomycetota bacterium]